MPLGFWGRVWFIWAMLLAAVILWFLTFEALALFDKVPGKTLSEHVWRLRGEQHWLYYVILDVWFLGAIALAWSGWHFIHQGLDR